MKVTSSDTSLTSMADMFSTMLRALSALSGLGIIEEFTILPLGLRPALLTEMRSTKMVSGVSPQEPALVMWMSPERWASATSLGSCSSSRYSEKTCFPVWCTRVSTFPPSSPAFPSSCVTS